MLCTHLLLFQFEQMTPFNKLWVNWHCWKIWGWHWLLDLVISLFYSVLTILDTLVPETLTWRDTQRETERGRGRVKGKTWSEEKGLWPRPLWIPLRCRNVVQILIGFLNSYPGATVDIWYNDNSYWLSICRHGSKVDNMEVRFSTAEARGPSLCLGFFLLFSLPACLPACRSLARSLAPSLPPSLPPSFSPSMLGPLVPG